MMMHMTFYWGTKVTLLFDSWTTDTWTSYALTLLFCFLLAAFYQFMEDRRIKFKLFAVTPAPAEASSVDVPLLTRAKLACRGGAVARFTEAVLFGVNSAIGYLLMLAVMCFNGGVFLAVVAGLSLGYFLYRSGADGTTVVVDNSCACA